MKGFVLVGLLASLAGACGHGRGGGPGSAPDGGTQGSSPITVVTGAPPALIVYREEAATAWQTPASTSTGRFDFGVTGPFRVIIVCGGSGLDVLVTQLARTPDDAPTIQQPCGTPTYPFHARGQMLQAGAVTFGNSGSGDDTVPRSFDLPVAAGTFDLVVQFGTFSTGYDHVEIRRDIAVTGDVALGTIDATHDATQALVATPFTASNLLPDESLLARTMLNSGNTSAFGGIEQQPGPGWKVNLVPGTALRPTDSQDVRLAASALLSSQPMEIATRSLTRRFHPGDSTSVTLMDRLGPIRFEPTADRLVATWTSPLPDYDEIEISRQSSSRAPAFSVVHDFRLSHAFIAATGATSATLDFTDVPGFQPPWRHDPALDQTFLILALRGTLPDDHTYSEVLEQHPAPASPTPSQGAATRAAR